MKGRLCVRLDKIQINTTTLKIIALITMIVDHVGAIIFPGINIFRQIGRLAFPIYAFLIGEGCVYSKNKIKYLLKVVATLIVFEIVSWCIGRPDGVSVLYGFACSILISIIVDWIKINPTKRRVVGVIPIMLLCISTIIIESSYLFFAIMLPLIVCYEKNKVVKMCMFAFVLVLLTISYQKNQWVCLFALIPLLLYNGKKGKEFLFKNSFYVLYPLHYAIIGLIKAFL